MNQKTNVSSTAATAILCLLLGGVIGYYSCYFTASAIPAVSASSLSPGMVLARLVRNLDTLQAMQDKGLTPEQTKMLFALLTRLKNAPEIPSAEAEKRTGEIMKILTPEQNSVLNKLIPPLPGAISGRADPRKPFASERNQKALIDLLAKLGKA